MRKHQTQNRLTLATEDEVLRFTGYAVGTVSPVGLRQHVRIFIDCQVVAEERVFVGSGLANAGIVMRSQDLLSALHDAEIVDLIQAP